MKPIFKLALVLWLSIFSAKLSAQIRMSGIFAFNQVGPQVTYGVERVDNYRSVFSVSGTLAIQLWATAFPYNGSGSLLGYKLTETSIGRLNGGFYFSNIVRTQTFFEPPAGNYNIVFVLAEWDGFEYVTVDWSNFSVRQTFGPIFVAPRITAQPQGLSLNVGQSGSFAVEASGTAPLFYQWYRNDVRIDGATQSSLTIFSARASDAGRYTVVVANTAGSVISSDATLVVRVVAPTIINSPASQVATAGSTVAFSVSASGSEPLVYQWKKGNSILSDSGNVSGASTARISLANVQPGDAGSYSCLVSNSAGTATSASASLTVNNPPQITTQPTGRTIAVGGSASFTVIATGTGPLSYQWKRGSTNVINGAGISGANTATLTLANAQSVHAGDYTVLVSNSVGSAASQPATLSVLSLPTIASQPTNRMIAVGSCVAFGVQAGGSPPYTYRWRKGTVTLLDGPNISGATTATLSLCNVQSGDAGAYSCVVSNAVGSVTSTAATLTVNNPPLITSQPTNRTIVAGASASFVVVATGTGPLSYQWKRGTNNLVNGAGVSGANTATLTVTGAQLAQAGSYIVVVANSVGTATSQPAILSVQSPPTIASQPTNRTIAAGSCVVFSVQAGGSPPYTYQWKKGAVALVNGPNITGANSTNLSLCNVQLGDAGTYSCVVTNAVGTATSSAATLTVNNAPQIASQPTNRTIAVGGSVSFTVVATGTGPLSYQWRRGATNVLNGAGVSGATSATLTLTSVQLAQAGNYIVVVTNSVGSVTSQPAILTVQPLQPVILSQPLSLVVLRTNRAATTATFRVEAGGAGTLSYQWRFNGTNLSNQTSPVLTLTNVRRSDSGLYSVRVSNSSGSIDSGNAVLRVIAPTTIQGISQRPDGQWRLSVADAEGIPFEVRNMPLLEIHGSESLSLPFSLWPNIGSSSNSVLSGGSLLIDIRATPGSSRYFRAVER